jgi:hypothetical protein
LVEIKICAESALVKDLAPSQLRFLTLIKDRFKDGDKLIGNAVNYIDESRVADSADAIEIVNKLS